MGMFADWAVRAVLFYCEWLLDVGCGNTLDPSRKSVKKASCVGINDKVQIISANDFNLKNRL